MLCGSVGSYSIAVQMQNLRSFAISISWFMHPSHPFQKASSSVSSLKVTGTYPNSVFIFITAAPLVRLNILALGHRKRANWKEACLIRLASPNPRKSGCTINPEVATFCYSGSAYFCCVSDCLQNSVNVNLMRGVGYHNIYLLSVHC